MENTMSQANNMSTTSRPLLSGQSAVALSTTIDRLKQIAAEAGDRLYLSDGPVQPDHELLGLTSEALRLLKRAGDMRASEQKARASAPRYKNGGLTEAARAESDKLITEIHAAEEAARKSLRRAGKIKAVTPAGIYAKALLVRSSTTGAAVLAMSLAADMVDCHALRATIWPNEGDQT
jgi:hypothetical protein